MREALMTDEGRAERVALALPLAVIVVDATLAILFVNPAAERFFNASAGHLFRRGIDELLPTGSALLSTVARARDSGGAVCVHGAPIALRAGPQRIADVIAAPMPGVEGATVLSIHVREFKERLDRQFLHRDSAHALVGMAAVLAHEIKNPLAGIRGAAQLLEVSIGESERELATLIRVESDRIRVLIDRMEICGDSRPPAAESVNIHEVLDQVRKIAYAGFARHVTFKDSFDPSLPLAAGDRDRLVQAFLNLVRNAADAVAQADGEIVLTTAYRSGMAVRTADGSARRALPLEITVRDNGHGIAPELLPYVFDPFVTTKRNGAGLGLALVARIVAEHDGVIECDSSPGDTTVRVLLPATNEQTRVSISTRRRGEAEATPVCHSRESGNPVASVRERNDFLHANGCRPGYRFAERERSDSFQTIAGAGFPLSRE